MRKIYRIRRGDGQWSRGGIDTVAADSYTRSRCWTDNIRKAKSWKRRSDLNNHLTIVARQCEAYGGVFPEDWEIVVFEVKEIEASSSAIKGILRYEGD